MKKVIMYGLLNCSTCQKAVQYLQESGVEIENFHDVKEDRLSRKEIKKLVEMVGGVEKLFSKRALKYRAMGLHERDLSEPEMIDLMIEEYTFIRRPVLVGEKIAMAGFSKKKYEEFIK